MAHTKYSDFGCGEAKIMEAIGTQRSLLSKVTPSVGSIPDHVKSKIFIKEQTWLRS
jgi:hypothetical protein